MLVASDRKSLGEAAEDRACLELERRGYVVLARQYRTRFGELDIVADDHGTLAFVEVRARRSRCNGTAAETIGPAKQRRIAAMALDYLAQIGNLDALCRFDVVTIDEAGTAAEELRVIRDAFQIDH